MPPTEGKGSGIQPSRTLSNLCLIEDASPALDASIHCAVLGTTDRNALTSATLRQARARGSILILKAGVRGWIEAPPYTSDLAWAKSLVPEDLATISPQPRIICATALIARAILDSPSFPLFGWRRHWQPMLPPQP